MKLAVLVYQAGIANVFRVERFTSPMNPTRLLQSDFQTCESFARGLAEAGVVITSMDCNKAGDITAQLWSESLDGPFRESYRPVFSRTPKPWPGEMNPDGSVMLKTSTLDGKSIAYGTSTEFLVQVGKGSGSYKTRNRVVGDLGQAVTLYRAINVGNGYKKRLLMPSCSKNPVIAKQAG